MVGGDGIACYSDDGGDSFVQASTTAGANLTGHLLWTGSELLTYGPNAVWRSPDGESWTSTPISPAMISLGAVARSDQGTFVAASGGYRQWYEMQRFYRSSDGVSWTELPSGSYRGGHPIRSIVFGLGAPSDLCPVR